MEQLVKAKESLTTQKQKVTAFIESEVKNNPQLAKAIQDLETINKALAATDEEIKKAEDLEKAKKAADEKAAKIKEAVKEVKGCLDAGEIDDDKVAEIAAKYELEVAELKAKVDEELKD